MELDVKLINLSLFILFFLFLSGCQSEIDKCVNAFAKDYPNVKKAEARIHCLKAANGNKE